jgi:hypothetical protein
MSHLVNSEVPLVAAEYVSLVLPEVDLQNVESIKEFKQNVVLQAQGDPVIIEESLFTLVKAALAFGAIADVATQVLVRTSDGKTAMIFDHETREFLPGIEIDMTVWEETSASRESLQPVSAVALPMPEITVDLWEEGALVEKLKPCITLHLIGEVPVLRLLSAIYLARPMCRMMDYTNAVGETISLFE